VINQSSIVALSFPQTIKQAVDNHSSWRPVCIGRHDEEFHEGHEQRSQAENDAGIYEQHDRGGKNRDDATNDAYNDEKHEAEHDDP